MRKGRAERQSELPTYRIDVGIERGQATSNYFSFHDAFHIGRDRGCEVQIMGDPSLSRNNVDVSFHDGS